MVMVLLSLGLCSLLWDVPAASSQVPVSVQKFVAAEFKKHVKAGLHKEPPEGLPPQNWGHAMTSLGLLKLANTTSSWKNLQSLWDKESLTDIAEQMSRVPKVASLFIEHFVLESRLSGTDTQIDYSIGPNVREFKALRTDPRVVALAAESPQWRLALDFFTSAAPEYQTELWLEFDQPTGPAAPSVFVCPADWVRDLLMPAKLEELGGNATNDYAEILEPMLHRIWSPFWSAMPWLKSTQKEVRRRLGEMIRNMAGLSVYQIGFWLSRDTGTLRLILESEAVYDNPRLYENTTEWWRVVRASLEKLGWRWPVERQKGGGQDVLDRMMPILMQHMSHFMVGLNVAGHTVHPKIGIEAYFEDKLIDEAQSQGVSTGNRPDLKGFADSAVSLGLCSPDKTQSLGFLKKTRSVKGFKYGGYQYDVKVYANHLKITFDPEKDVELKLYTTFGWKWINKKGRWWETKEDL